VRTLAVVVALSITAACSSSDDAAVDDASLDSGVDSGNDVGSRRCRFSSCCCKDGHQTSAACAADGTGACPAGWTYNYDDCPFQPSCGTFDAAIPDTRADGDAAVCDAAEWCCCDLDVTKTPSCGDAGLSCEAPYVLMTAERCATDCVLRTDAGAHD
jgi:hypothetical protein